MGAAWDTDREPDATSKFEVSNRLYGTVSAIPSATKIEDSNLKLVADAFKDYKIVITGGKGAGQIRTIKENAVNSITVTTAWDADVTSTYMICEQDPSKDVMLPVLNQGAGIFVSIDFGFRRHIVRVAGAAGNNYRDPGELMTGANNGDLGPDLNFDYDYKNDRPISDYAIKSFIADSPISVAIKSTRICGGALIRGKKGSAITAEQYTPAGLIFIQMAARFRYN